MSNKVLSVDDSRMVHMVVTKALKPLGVDVITAVNGQEGVDKAISEKPNLIILDATMPVMTGIEALEKLKQDPGTRDIPVIMLSADAGRDNIDRAIQLGALKFITKPFSADGLIETLSPYLDLPPKA
jgi:two-component system, cell cycle response regulator